jgi:hypothetical protein
MTTFAMSLFFVDPLATLPAYYSVHFGASKEFCLKILPLIVSHKSLNQNYVTKRPIVENKQALNLI